MIKIKTYKITSNCCPYQVECRTYDRRAVYIRSRHNYFYVAIGKNINKAVRGEILLEKEYDVYDIESIIDETKGILDFSKAKEVEENGR